MPLRTPACRRAVQQHIRGPGDAVFITDAVLANAFERFCLISRPSRRHGCSVPGPMESRRRLGRRRMTQLSDAAVMAPQDQFLSWGTSGAMDASFKWQWEAPSSRPHEEFTTQSPALPSWLTAWLPPPLDQSETLERQPLELDEVPLVERKPVGHDLKLFQEALRAAAPHEVTGVCDTFNKSFQQSLTLGLLSENTILENIRQVTREIRKASYDELLERKLSMSFYSALWDGVKSCRVLQPGDLGVNIIDRILFGLSEFSLDEGVITLATDVLNTGIRDFGPLQLEQALLALANAWTLSNIDVPEDFDLKAQDALPSVATPYEGQYMLLSIRFITAVANSLEQISHLEAVLFIRSSTSHMIGTIFERSSSLKAQRVVRRSWMSMVAKLSCADDDLLLEIWTKLDFVSRREDGGHYKACIPRMTMYESCELLLDYWSTHSRFQNPDSIREKFSISIEEHGNKNAAIHLLQAVAVGEGSVDGTASSIFQILRRLEKPHAIYSILQALPDRGMTLQPGTIAQEIQAISQQYPRCALNIFKLHPKLLHDQQQWQLDSFPDLIKAMIMDPTFHPFEIWGTLRIRLDGRRRVGKGSRTLLNKEKVALMHMMAHSFSHARDRPYRVALRNVMRVALYLRSHGVPVSPQLTRSFSHVGLERGLLEGQWIGTSKLQWFLDVVEKGEGKGVAMGVNKAVNMWLERNIEQWRKEKREGNPLRVGPID